MIVKAIVAFLVGAVLAVLVIGVGEVIMRIHWYGSGQGKYHIQTGKGADFRTNEYRIEKNSDTSCVYAPGKTLCERDIWVEDDGHYSGKL